MSSRPTVIVADQSEAFLMYVSILLQRLNFEVLPLGTGQHVLSMAKAILPDLLILGVSLPDMKGIDVVRALKRDEACLTIPVIIAGDKDTDGKIFLDHGCHDYVTKPIALDQLYKSIGSSGVFPHHQRTFMRIPFPEKIVLSTADQQFECQAVSLSEGGIYIRRKLPLPRGCVLDITLPLPGGVTLNLAGEVIYTKQLSGDRMTLPPGMAVRFREVGQQDALILRDFVEKHLVGDLIAEQDEPVIQA